MLGASMARRHHAALIDEVLTALLARHRAADVDASYAAYDEHPLDEPDAWAIRRRFVGRPAHRERASVSQQVT